MIVSDACGPLNPSETIRRTLTGTYQADATGPVLLEMYNWKEGPYASLCVCFIDNLRVYVEEADFSASKRIIPYESGGISQLTLQAGPEYANRFYIILSSVSGTWPGFSLSGVEIPLNLDAWTKVALTLLNTSIMFNFMGQLDALGEATALLNVPGNNPPQLIGVPFYFNCLVLEHHGSGPVLKASHPENILFVP